MTNTLNTTRIITVLGLGKVGSVITSLLLSQQESFVINVMDPNPQAEGNLLDLQHMAALEKRHRFVLNSNDLFERSDFVFHTAGATVVHGESRLDVAEESIKITREIFKDIRFKTKPYVIVIANPVDIISYLTWKLTGLSNNHVIGTGTLVDTIRLDYYLAEALNEESRNIKSWVVGEHGDHLVPLYSHTSVNLQPVTNRTLFNQAAEKTRKAAFEIRKTKAGTTFGVAECALHIMYSILYPHSEALTLSVLLNDYHLNLLQCPRLFMSIPVKITENGVHQALDFGYSDEELRMLKQAAHTLKEVLDKNQLSEKQKL